MAKELRQFKEQEPCEDAISRKEPTLDKIRAEISDFEEEVFNRPNTDYSDYAAVRHCLEIIDKYKAEREDK